MPRLPDPGGRLLLAGCGDLGARIGLLLAKAGAQVFALSRRCLAPPPLIAVPGDVGDPQTLASLPGSIETLVYCLSPDERSEAAYHRVYVVGLRNLLAALLPARPRVLFISSTAVYGADDGRPLDETSDCAPTSFNGRLLLEAEAIALAAHPDSLVLRLGGIYGPGRESLVRAALGTGAAPSPAGQIGNRIQVEDAARAACHLLRGGHRGVFNGVDDRPASSAEVIAWIATQLGRTASVQRVAGAPTGKAVSNARLRATGFVPEYPDYRQGYGALLARFC
ncbi:MAG: NAD-dependent epimerase/dehydratase family protein [Lysobacterales bacterium]